MTKFSATLVNWFQLRFPEYANLMKECSHKYNDSNLNPYHIEDSVWTHTCMALAVAEQAKFPQKIMITMLLHDLGKCYVRQEMDDEKKKVRFTNHASVSFFRAGEVLSEFIKETGMTLSEKEDILFLIANHGLLFDDNLEMDSIREKLGYYGRYIPQLLDIAYLDGAGRFNINPKGNNLDYETYRGLRELEQGKEYKQESSLIISGKPTITLMIGLPGSGKSTYIYRKRDFHDMDTHILSRDALLLEMAETRNYDYAWKTVDHKAVDKELERRFNEIIKARKNIVIDMMNMSKKSRRKWLSQAIGYKKVGVICYSDVNVIYKRLLDRLEKEQKTIPANVITQQMAGFTFPLYDEFDELEFKSTDDEPVKSIILNVENN